MSCTLYARESILSFLSRKREAKRKIFALLYFAAAPEPHAKHERKQNHFYTFVFVSLDLKYVVKTPTTLVLHFDDDEEEEEEEGGELLHIRRAECLPHMQCTSSESPGRGSKVVHMAPRRCLLAC